MTSGEAVWRRPLAGRRLAGGLAREEVVAAAVLAAMVAVGAKLAFDAAAMPSRPLVFSLAGRGFPGWLSGPFHGLGDHLTWASFYAMVLGLCGLWATAWRLAGAIRLRWALAAVGALHVLFALAPPIGLSDAFNYVAYGRLAVEHGLNPYTDSIVQVPGDPAFAYATWPDWPNPYGPLATLAFLPLGLTGVPPGLWLAKLAAAATSLAVVGLTAACARELGRPVTPAVVFVGLNPVLLVYAVAGAHVDLLLVALSMAGVWLVLRGRAAGGGAVLAAGAAVKATGAIPLAFALAGARGAGGTARAAASRTGPATDRRRLALGAALIGAALAGLALALFGPHLLSGVADQREVPAALAVLAALGFAGATTWLLRAAWRGADWIEAAGWATVALLLALTWLMPWYVVWLLPLAALAAGPRLRYAAAALTVFVVAVRIIPLG